MGKREQILSGSRLFEGIDPREIEQLLPCLRPKILNPLPGELLLAPGEEVTAELCLVLRRMEAGGISLHGEKSAPPQTVWTVKNGAV